MWGKRGLFLAVLPHLTPSFASAKSRLLELFPQCYAASQEGLVLEGRLAWKRTGLQCCEADLNSSFLVFQMFSSYPGS